MPRSFAIPIEEMYLWQFIGGILRFLWRRIFESSGVRIEKSFFMLILSPWARRRSAEKAWNVLTIGSFSSWREERILVRRLFAASFEKVMQTIFSGG